MVAVRPAKVMLASNKEAEPKLAELKMLRYGRGQRDSSGGHFGDQVRKRSRGGMVAVWNMETTAKIPGCSERQHEGLMLEKMREGLRWKQLHSGTSQKKKKKQW